MPSTFLGLTISYTGLQASQTAINTTFHNIANVKTEGYSRQQASQSATGALRSNNSYGMIGSGVEITSITQIRDSYYDVKYRNNRAKYGEYDVKESYIRQIEDYLNEFKLSGFTEEYNDFFTSISELQKNPTSQSIQNSFVNNAISLTSYFNTLSANLTNIQIDVNEEIRNQVSSINTYAQNIAALTKQINQLEASNGTANDLRDQRNYLVDQLSDIVNIDTSEQDMGNGLTSYVVSINGQILVNTYDYYTLTTEPRQEKVNASDATGLYNIKWTSGLEFNEYSQTLGGSIKGLIDLRDGSNGSVETISIDGDGNKTLELVNNTSQKTEYKGVPYYVSKLNQFIDTFTSGINDILTSGQTVSGEKGIPLFTVKYDNTAMSALSVTVNKEIINDVTKLATTTDPAKGEAYCDIIDKLADFEDSKVFEGGTGAYFLESLVAEVAIDSDKASTFLKNYTTISGTIQNQRLSVMGVDEDEEGMDVLQFQQAYNLSAKMMSIMNEIYNKLINETGI